MLQFIGNFASWELGKNRTYIDVSQALVRAAYAPIGDATEYEPPLVADSFAGGGSIPLEALLVGCQAFASDLNPVACFILKVMLESTPRNGPKFVQELEHAGAEIRRQVDLELASFYPNDPNGGKPIAYLWARSIHCESPNCGAEIPLTRSFWLCKKTKRRRALRYYVKRSRGEVPSVEFEIYEPKNEKEVQSGTVTRAKATCVCCESVLPRERVRAQLVAQHGGADVVFDKKGRRTAGARMLAVVTLRSNEAGRQYRLPTERDYDPVRRAQVRVAELLEEWQASGGSGLCPLPDEPTPTGGGSGAGRAFSMQSYGMFKWIDLFTARQKIALMCVARAVREGDQPALALALGKLADLSTSGCLWHTKNECPNQVLTTARIKPFWDFAEGVPTSSSSGSIEVCVEKLVGGIASALVGNVAATVTVAAAQSTPLPDDGADIWFVDPPYYDAVPYADLSDFFLVWLKRALPGNPLLNDPFDTKNPLSPKREEAVQDESRRDDGRVKDPRWFEETMAKAFADGRRILRGDGVASIVFAHKTTEGWEALLSGITRGGWTITGSWPIATEMTTRLRARESAALATSVHLICRPRPDDASVGDWATVLRELPARVTTWMGRLQTEGVRGADLVFACIGPALEIFSRYDKVETAEGREVRLDEYLTKVWEVVGRSALGQVLGTAEARAQNGAAGAVEEDARLTALFLWTLQATGGEASQAAEEAEMDEEVTNDEDDDDEDAPRGKVKGFKLVFDVVRRFAQPLGIELRKWEGRVIDIKKGVVRLLPVGERMTQLFGEDGAHAVAARLEQTASLGPDSLQGVLFPEMEASRTVSGRGKRDRRFATGVSDDVAVVVREATTLDRVHAAMLLQSSGCTNALRTLLKGEQDRGPDFLRLANALSALYPLGSDEKRLVDAMLLAAPR
jgi:adenine-specific DNA methylase